MSQAFKSDRPQIFSKMRESFVYSRTGTIELPFKNHKPYLGHEVLKSVREGKIKHDY